MRSLTRSAALLALSAFVLALFATSALAHHHRHHHHRHGPISGASAFTLPSKSHCVQGGQLSVRLRQVPRVRWTRVLVKVNGATLETISRSKLSPVLKITGLPSGKFALSVTAFASDGRSATATGHYRSCAVSPPVQPPVPPVVTPTSDSAPAPGSFSGGSWQNYNVSLNVSSDGTQINDVTAVYVGMECTSANAKRFELSFDEIPIKSDGSFSAERTTEAPLERVMGKFTYTFSGRVVGTSASGNLRERVSYTDGSSHQCDSNDVTWNAIRDNQGSLALPVPSGSYSGGSWQNYNVSLNVSSDGTQINDVTAVYVGMECTSANAKRFELSFDEIPIKSDGSFSAERTTEAPLEGVMATFTYKFRGHYHGFGTSVARLGGSLDEEVTYNDGAEHTCRSNDVTWNAIRDSQGSLALPVPSGSYSGGSWQNYNVSLNVSSDGTQINDVTAVYVGMECTSANAKRFELSFDEIPIKSDGSFSAERTTEAPLEGVMATFTYKFRGHYHGFGTSVARLGGSLDEEVTYNDGAEHTCRSNDVTWNAIRDSQGSLALPVPSGSYSGGSWQNYNVALAVSADHSHLTNVVVTYVGMECTSAASKRFALSFDEIALEADGSFIAEKSVDSPLEGTTGHFTYTFRGHYHGFNTSDARLGGTLRETVTYDNGAQHSCDSNDVTWGAQS